MYNYITIYCNVFIIIATNIMKGGNMEELYKKYKNDVYLYLYSLTHNITLAEDLTSETFLGAIKTIHSFKGQSSVKI